MGNRKIVAINTASQVIGKIITGVSTFICTIILARMLGAEGYGDFTKITVFVAFFYLFADFGMNASYLEHAELPGMARVLLTVRVIAGVCLSLLCVAIVAFLPETFFGGYTPVVKLGIIMFSVSIVFQALITTANAFFQKKLRYDYAVLSLTIGSLFVVVCVWLLSFSHTASVLPFVAIVLAGSGIAAALALFFGSRCVSGLGLSWSPPLLRTLLLTALPLGLTLLCNAVYFHADSIILTVTRTTAEVGIYGLAYKMFEMPLSIPTFFMNSVFPLLLLSRKNNDIPLFLRQLKQSVVVSLSLSLVTVIICFFLSPLLSVIRSDFQASVLPFRILSVSIPIFFLSAVTMWTMIALKRRAALLGIYGFSMILNVTSNMYFVPRYGYIASAWITVASELCILFVSTIVIYHALREERRTIIHR